MYSGITFRPSPIEWIREDLMEIASVYPETSRLQLVGADPFCLDFNRLNNICDLVHEYLPHVEIMTMAARVDNMRNKSVEQLEILKDKGMSEVNIGVESGDDNTLKRINKGYKSKDILEQCGKLDDAGISYWLTFLNGAGGRSLSYDHASNSAEIFSQLHPIVVGTGGLVLFEGTVLRSEFDAGLFDMCSERELMEELLLFVENLDFDGRFITHHTSSMNLNTFNYKEDKKRIVESLRPGIENLDMNVLTDIRNNKIGL
ncbi:radical SAM protein [Methanosphaera sp. ISO3-F5]